MFVVLQGTGFVYQTFLRPYVSRHESEIDRQLMEWKAKGWDMFSRYWGMFAKSGHSAFFQALEYVATQSVRLKVNPNGHGRYQTTSQVISSLHFTLFPEFVQIAPAITKIRKILHSLYLYTC